MAVEDQLGKGSHGNVLKEAALGPSYQKLIVDLCMGTGRRQDPCVPCVWCVWRTESTGRSRSKSNLSLSLALLSGAYL